MESHEVLKTTVSGAGVKSVSADMGLSPSLIYKWCEAKGEDASGTDNPMDRLLRLCQVTGNHAPIIWLCEQVNGFFVTNTSSDIETENLKALDMTQQILKEFSGMLDMVSRSMANDGGIDRQEARDIREEWEALKRVAEQFVTACETEVFSPPVTKHDSSETELACQPNPFLTS